jgi:Holliday junction DNA helicase RuvA
MIGYLQGEVLDSSDGKTIVGIGEKNNGRVGYLVTVPQSAEYQAHIVGQSVELFIYSHVREDAFDLYGFNSRMEKNLFLTLLDVNGIGPKSAMGILSAVNPQSLIEAIINEDQAYLTRIPGIGKKTAERVMVELKDKVRKKVEAGEFPINSPSHSTSPTSTVGKSSSSTAGIARQELELISDAKAALVGLGYRENDIYPLLRKILEESQPRFRKAEDLVKGALRHL